MSVLSPRSQIRRARGGLSLLAVLVAFLTLVAVAAAPAYAQESGDEMSEDEKLLYALGLMLSQQIAPLGFDADEVATIQAGFSDGALQEEAKVDLPTYAPKVQAMAKERASAGAEREKAAGEAFLEEQAQRDGAVVTDTGLVYIETVAGEGESPKKNDTVKVHYVGTLRNGEIFDQSRNRGGPATFALDAVIKCWQEGVSMMKVGGQATLVCPSDLAYGSRSTGNIPANSALVFDIELLEIVE